MCKISLSGTEIFTVYRNHKKASEISPEAFFIELILTKVNQQYKFQVNNLQLNLADNHVIFRPCKLPFDTRN